MNPIAMHTHAVLLLFLFDRAAAAAHLAPSDVIVAEEHAAARARPQLPHHAPAPRQQVALRCRALLRAAAGPGQRLMQAQKLPLQLLLPLLQLVLLPLLVGPVPQGMG